MGMTQLSDVGEGIRLLLTGMCLIWGMLSETSCEAFLATWKTLSLEFLELETLIKGAVLSKKYILRSCSDVN